MSDTRHIISDASKLIDVEPYNLRYWEEELSLEIPRNEMGHRYYRDQELELFKKIKVLKEQGFQLKAIKMLISDNKLDNLDTQAILKLKDEWNNIAKEEETPNKTNSIVKEDSIEAQEEASEERESLRLTEEQNSSIESTNKMGQFRTIIGHEMMKALKENNRELTEDMSVKISDNVLKEMDYLLRMKEEREDQRFRKLDELIRQQQRSRQEVAAASVDYKISKKKKGLFHKKNSYR